MGGSAYIPDAMPPPAGAHALPGQWSAGVPGGGGGGGETGGSWRAKSSGGGGGGAEDVELEKELFERHEKRNWSWSWSSAAYGPRWGVRINPVSFLASVAIIPGFAVRPLCACQLLLAPRSAEMVSRVLKMAAIAAADCTQI